MSFEGFHPAKASNSLMVTEIPGLWLSSGDFSGSSQLQLLCYGYNGKDVKRKGCLKGQDPW